MTAATTDEARQLALLLAAYGIGAHVLREAAVGLERLAAGARNEIAADAYATRQDADDATRRAREHKRHAYWLVALADALDAAAEAGQ